MLPSGDLRTYSRATHSEQELASTAVNLGCLGPISRLSVDIVEAYDIEQRCYTMPMPEYLANFHEMVDRHDSVSTFANFGDDVCEWTFQRDRVSVGSSISNSSSEGASAAEGGADADSITAVTDRREGFQSISRQPQPQIFAPPTRIHGGTGVLREVRPIVLSQTCNNVLPNDTASNNLTGTCNNVLLIIMSFL